MAQLPNKQSTATASPASLKQQAPATADVVKKRNKRAEVTDHFRPASTDPKAIEQFNTTMKSVGAAWDHIRQALSKAGIKYGTTFTTPDGGNFFADLSKYPVEIVLQLAQSRQHNKLMDSYSDPVEAPDVIHEVRSVDAELVKGVWSQRGEGAGPRFTLLERAVAELNSVTNEQASARLAELGIKKVSDIQNGEAIKARMEQIKLRDAQARVAASAEKAKGVALPKLF